MNWAVPVFFMITGHLLLQEDREIVYNTCIKKYAKRIFLALFIFGIPFSMMEIYMSTRTLSIDLLWNSILNVMEGKSWGHLWYLYALIGIYLILPFVKAATDHMERNQIKALLIVLLVFNFFFPLVENPTGIEFGFYIPISSFSLFYLIAGKYVSDYWKLKRRSSALVGCICGLVCICCVVIGVNNFSGLVACSSPLIVVLSIAVFMMFRGVQVDDGWTERLWKIDRLCFGVYLIHPLFINFVYKFLKITPVSFDMWWLMVLVFWVLFVCCGFLTSWVMSKIKPLKKYVL